jgi:acyl carrier protein
MRTENPEVTTTMVPEATSVDATISTRKEAPTAAEIQTWMVSYLADLLEIDPDDVDVASPFDQYGLDSAVAVGMTGDLEDWLGSQLDPTLLYDYPTIESLSHHLAEGFKATR